MCSPAPSTRRRPTADARPARHEPRGGAADPGAGAGTCQGDGPSSSAAVRGLDGGCSRPQFRGGSRPRDLCCPGRDRRLPARCCVPVPGVMARRPRARRSFAGGLSSTRNIPAAAREARHPRVLNPETTQGSGWRRAEADGSRSAPARLWAAQLTGRQGHFTQKAQKPPVSDG